MAATPVRKLSALTSLRFVAAALIVVCHSRGNFGLPLKFGDSFNLTHGVSFFFVLSGFILTYVYPRLDGFADRGRFLLARFARLWPAHLLAAAGMVLLFGPPVNIDGITPTSPKIIAANLLMVHSWIPFPRVYYSLNHLSWTIATEFFFYLAFMTVLIWRWRQTWHIKLALSFALVVAICWVCRDGHIPGYPDIGHGSLLYINPLARLFEFTLGMCTALAFRALLPRIRIGVILGTLLEVAVLALAVGSNYLVKQHLIHGPLTERFGIPFIEWLSWGPACAPAFALVILVMALERGAVSRLLSFTPFVILGEISYTVYLIHPLLLRFCADHAGYFLLVPNWVKLTSVWLMLLALAHLIWCGWERPLRRLLLSLWPRRASAVVPVEEPALVTFWGRLLAPSPRRVAVELGLMLLLLVPFGWYVTRPVNTPVDAQTVTELEAKSIPEFRDVHFGPNFILHAVHYEKAKKGYYIQLAWESCQDQRLDCWEAVEMMDEKWEKKTEMSHLQDPQRAAVSKGALWTETVYVPARMLRNGVKTIAIMLWHPRDGVLLTDHGPRDPWHARITLPLPQE